MTESLERSGLHNSAEASKFWYLGKTKENYSGYAAEEISVERQFVSYRLRDFECGFESLTRFTNLASSQCCYLEITNARLVSLYETNLLPSSAERLVSLRLINVHLESFDPVFLSNFVNMQNLSLQVTFSKSVKVELDFLGALTKLIKLELTLKDTPSDLSVFKTLTKLERLKLEGSSFFYAEKLPRLSKVVLEQILSSKCLRELKLSYFDIETINRDFFDDCRRLESLELAENQLGDCEYLNIGRLFDKSRRPTNYINLRHSNIRALNVASFARMWHLRHLSLTGNSISDLPRAVFHDLRSLLRLDLEMNQIRHISSGVFGDLGKLWLLTLDGNPIESIEANAFTKLTNLTYLSLQECRLKSIDSRMFVGLAVLNGLELSNNLIERIEVIAENGRRINVAKADLTNEEKELVKKHLFKDMFFLQELDLSGNRLEKLDLNCFNNLTSLKELNMSSNMINELSGEAGPELLCNLIELSLDANQLTAIDKSALPKSVTSLNLSKNNLRRLDDDFFAEFTRLEYVNLSKNELTWTVSDASFANNHIKTSLWENASIRVTEGAPRQLLLPYNNDISEEFKNNSPSKRLKIKRLTPEVIRVLIESRTVQRSRESGRLLWYISACSIRVLTRKPVLESEKETHHTDLFNLSWLPNASRTSELDFSGNLIETLDDPELFVGFYQTSRINLSHNRLSRIHRDIFKCLSNLCHIDLTGNSLCSIDMGLFRHLNSFKHLNLSSNGIAFLNLARLFRICPELELLNIAYNKLDDRSTAEPIDAKTSYFLGEFYMANNCLEKMDFVRDMTSLQHLDFRGNRIESVMSNGGENLLGRLKRLTHLDLSGNHINWLTDEMFAHIRDRLSYLDLSENPLHALQLESVLSELVI